MEIVTFPHPALLMICEDVSVFDDDLSIVLDNMYSIVLKERAVGLASNQIGLNRRMFVMNYEDSPLFLINPKIVWKSKELTSIKEGCLSAPGEFILIRDRSKYVKIEFQDKKGNKHSKIFSDIYSVACQHEIDHLDGLSFLESKSLPKKMRMELLKKWNIKKDL